MMSKLLLALLFLLPLLGACTESEWQQTGRQVLTQIGNGPSNDSALSLQEIDAGLKEALRVGTDRVVGQLGATDGFNADAQIRIPLPAKLAASREMLGSLGLGRLYNDLELRLNRAAEAAAPEARDIFWKAISEVSIEDARSIFNGPEDAATRYFERKMTPELAAAMEPVVEQSLSEVGAVQVYNQAVAQVRALPYAPDVGTDLNGYVVEQAMDGIFHYLAQEEAAIRQDPARRTTQLLQRVFGGK